MVTHRCKMCAWWDNQHKSLDELGNKGLGYCRKHKPVVYQQGDRFYGSWPIVDENDLCGEFRIDVQQEQ